MRRGATRRWSVPLAVVSLALTTTVATAQTLVYEHQDEPLFSIEVPEGWLLDLDFEDEARDAGIPEGEKPVLRIVEVSPGDGGHVWLGVWAVPKSKTLDEAEAYMLGLRTDLFTDLEVESPTETEFKGMAARRWQGSGRHEGEAVEFSAALFETRSGTIAAALYVGAVDAWKVYREELEAMVMSLEPAGD